MRYPEYATDIKLNRYAGLMNHLVGLADELGSFYLELSNERKGTAPEEESQVERSEESFLAGGKHGEDNGKRVHFGGNEAGQ